MSYNDDSDDNGDNFRPLSLYDRGRRAGSFYIPPAFGAFGALTAAAAVLDEEGKDSGNSAPVHNGSVIGQVVDVQEAKTPLPLSTRWEETDGAALISPIIRNSYDEKKEHDGSHRPNVGAVRSNNKMTLGASCRTVDHCDGSEYLDSSGANSFVVRDDMKAMMGVSCSTSDYDDDNECLDNGGGSESLNAKESAIMAMMERCKVRGNGETHGGNGSVSLSNSSVGGLGRSSTMPMKSTKHITPACLVCKGTNFSDLTGKGVFVCSKCGTPSHHQRWSSKHIRTYTESVCKDTPDQHLSGMISSSRRMSLSSFKSLTNMSKSVRRSPPAVISPETSSEGKKKTSFHLSPLAVPASPLNSLSLTAPPDKTNWRNIVRNHSMFSSRRKKGNPSVVGSDSSVLGVQDTSYARPMEFDPSALMGNVSPFHKSFNDDDASTASNVSTFSTISNTLRLVALLMNPLLKKFEILQLEFPKANGAVVADALVQIREKVTDPVLRSTNWEGICLVVQNETRPGVVSGDELLTSLLMSHYNIESGDTVIAIPEGLTGKKCIRIAAPIINGPQMTKIVRRLHRKVRSVIF